jgi:hypothetical protein
MPLTIENAAALIAGAALPKAMRTVQVVRAFMYAGQRQEPGQTAELPALLAAEMIAAGKAEVVPATPPAVDPAAATDTPPPAATKKAARDNAGTTGS